MTASLDGNHVWSKGPKGGLMPWRRKKASYSKEVSLLGPTEYPGVLGGGGVRGGPKALKKKAGKQLLTAR